MDAAIPVVPYCGLPPDPGAIWSSWRLDPVVLSVLAGVWLCYWIGCRHLRMSATSGRPSRTQQWLFHAGWTIATLALVSPLCPLSVSLFAARATQHVVLTLIAAPLVVAGRPLQVLAAAGLHGSDGLRRLAVMLRSAPLAAAGVFALVVWIWHMPGPYAATFASVAVYWSMHVSMFAAALWLWSSLLGETRRELIGGVFAGIGSAIQMGLLGALITLSPRAFYVPHFLTTQAWGMSPLQDQQLGGAIMWVIGCTVFFSIALVGIANGLGGRSPARAPVPLPAAAPLRIARPEQIR